MRTGEAASALGVSQSTVIKWLSRRELEPFISPAGRGEGLPQRVLSEPDMLVLNTVQYLRSTENISEWPEIVARIEAGFRHREFPANATSVGRRVIPEDQATQSVRAAATMAERDAALKRVTELEEEVKNLRAEKELIREQLIREIIELNRKIGQLEGRLSAKDD